MTGLIILIISGLATAACVLIFACFARYFDDDGGGYMRVYQCKNCGAIYKPDKVPFICKNCGKEITAKRTLGEYRADDLSMDRKMTGNCRIVIAKRTLRGWVVLPEGAEK